MHVNKLSKKKLSNLRIYGIIIANLPLSELFACLSCRGCIIKFQLSAKCEGLSSADGRCPRYVNNRTVKQSQGDLMLCQSCEVTRFPEITSRAGNIPVSSVYTLGTA